MQKTLGEIAECVGGELVGKADLMITGFSGIKEATPGDITFVANSKYSPLIKSTKASAVIVPSDLKIDQPATIRTSNPSLAFAKAIAMVVDDHLPRIKGIHQTAVIAESAVIGKNVSIGPYVVVDDKAVIEDDTVIYSGCYIGTRAGIGKACIIYPNVSIRERVSIGSRVIIHSGTVIGSDGFGFVKVKNEHVKIPQIGTVIIEDNVEIGANVTIDRARFDKTVVGSGTKIDNLVQIAHNVRIGKNCIIVSQVGISGSTILEDNVILAGQAGLAGHITIGKNSIVAAQAGVANSVDPNTTVWGFPAKPHMHAKRVNAHLQRLPNLVKTINDLNKRVKELEDKLRRTQSGS